MLPALLVNLNRKGCSAMNENRSEMYSAASGYYDLPVKERQACSKYNRKRFSERENNCLHAAEILCAIQAVCAAFLKTALFCSLIALFAFPVVLTIIVLAATTSVFQIFRCR